MSANITRTLSLAASYDTVKPIGKDLLDLFLDTPGRHRVDLVVAWVIRSKH